jgi:hypothetical protein
MQNQFSGRARLGDGSARSSEKPKRMWSVRKGETVNRVLLWDALARASSLRVCVMPCGLRFAGRETVKGFPAVVGVSLRGRANLMRRRAVQKSNYEDRD